MKRNFLITLHEKVVQNSNTPWGCFETNGIDEDGQVSFSISYNKAFIKNLQAAGFGGINDEETVQMFFLSARMMPDDDAVNPEATPNLTNEANFLKR